MSTIPLDQLGAAAGDDGLRRDRWGRLLVVNPEGRLEGYTRVTTIAKTTDEGGGLIPWKATMAVCGTLGSRKLRAQWNTLLAAHRSPWYAGEEPKAACKRLVEECAEAGGAGDRREEGKALHAVMAQILRGEEPAFLDETMAADVEAARARLAEFGVGIVSGWVEATVVLDSVKVGGSFDALMSVTGRPKPMIADWKTGADLSYSWPSFAVQLAAYAHGEAAYTQGPAADGSQDVRATMPDVDQTEGLVIWLPAGSARCEIFVVDLEAGWEGFQLSMAVRAWRKSGPQLWSPLSQWTPAPLQLVPSPPAIEQAKAAHPSNGTPAEPTTAQVRAWLQARIDAIGAFSPEARAHLVEQWPLGVGSLKSYAPHTLEELAAIERCVDQVEAWFLIPFETDATGRDPLHERRVLARVRNTFAETTTVQEPFP